ncbi:N4-gp56 family major capsid protein [Shewanella sp. 202IG2-18]|uniref:N4-gp56 family major capsid protein n=1 Tax=Parashewanella hymeniacidonis TaxID=2807618 RepID=UPI001961F115|nr:N4-gp56 family major capsid protein [Parashewanella hymeniacidonis]MBM7070879.1 N4-gp56 family major capsid protein [Parashewanella hymeniacidonis]
MAVTKAQAAKVFGSALFTHANRQNTFVNMLTGKAPQQAMRKKNNGKDQTEAGAPVVRITDLSKQAGTTVELDLFHDLVGLPTMGDQRLEGRGEDLTKTEFELEIDQGRKMVESGGKMQQKRTKHNLLSTGKTLMQDFFGRYQDEQAMYHLAGARGFYQADDIIMPLESHHEFKKLMVNEVTPPTYDRHLFGGDATSFEGIDSADILTLDKIDDIALSLEEMVNPIRPVRFEDDKMAGENPFHVLFVTPRQWADFRASMSDKQALQLQAAASTRRQGFNHQIFSGDCFMWRNILIRQYKKPVRFYAGNTVTVSENNDKATTRQVTASTTIDRAILLGGQALASAYGATASGAQFNMMTKKVDYENSTDIVMQWMNGLKKIRFESRTGRVNDFGVLNLDTAITQ